MKYPARTIGLFQAAGITLYVIIFAIAGNSFREWITTHNIQPHPVLGITMFLLAFIISAIVCGSLFLGYPALLFFEQKKDVAVKIIISSLGWLLFFFVIFALVGSFILLR